MGHGGTNSIAADSSKVIEEFRVNEVVRNAVERSVTLQKPVSQFVLPRIRRHQASNHRLTPYGFLIHHPRQDSCPLFSFHFFFPEDMYLFQPL